MKKQVNILERLRKSYKCMGEKKSLVRKSEWPVGSFGTYFEFEYRQGKLTRFSIISCLHPNKVVCLT